MEVKRHEMFEYADYPINFGELSHAARLHSLNNQTAMIKRVVWRLNPELFKYIYGRIFYSSDDGGNSRTIYRDPLEAKATGLGKLTIAEGLLAPLTRLVTFQFDPKEMLDFYLLETGRFAIGQDQGTRPYEGGKSMGPYDEYGNVAEQSLSVLNPKYAEHMSILSSSTDEIGKMVDVLLT